MAKRVDLTDDEIKFISDLLDFWSEGYKEAKDLTIQDRNLDFEDVLILSASYEEDEQRVVDIQEKLGLLPRQVPA